MSMSLTLALEVNLEESMDANKDGAVTKDEHPRPEFFNRSDKDGDGKITLEEMQKASLERGPGQGQGKGP